MAQDWQRADARLAEWTEIVLVDIGLTFTGDIFSEH
jgi:hypothetical protein